MPMEILKQEVRNTLLNGAAIFFPDRQTRRNHLFTMMVTILRTPFLSGWDLSVSPFSEYTVSLVFRCLLVLLCTKLHETQASKGMARYSANLFHKP